MKNKEADIEFCNVDKDRIKSASPKLNEEVLRHHHLYITERTEIYKRKEIYNLPQPWTEDEVFLKYRFTNVRRELDRESKWLIENIAENDKLSLKEKIYNCMLFRTFNKSSTSELYGGVVTDIENADLDQYKSIFIDHAKKFPKYVFFTPAFMSGGLKKGSAFKVPPYVRREVNLINPDGTKTPMEYIKARDLANEDWNYDIEEWERNIPTRMIRFVQREVKEGIVERIIDSKDQDEVFKILNGVTGFGHFLAYQVFVDLTYIPEFKYSENEFVVSGPGCSSGLSLLFDDKDGMNDEELLFWCRDNLENEWDKRGMHVDMKSLFDFLAPQDRGLNVMLLENSMCELSKLVKSKRGTGRPRNKYVPTESATLGEW